MPIAANLRHRRRKAMKNSHNSGQTEQSKSSSWHPILGNLLGPVSRLMRPTPLHEPPELIGNPIRSRWSNFFHRDFVNHLQKNSQRSSHQQISMDVKLTATFPESS